MSDTSVSKKITGRPPKHLEWPKDVNFTVKDLFEKCNKTISKVTIKSKIDKAMAAQKIMAMGPDENKVGRKAILYRLNNPIMTSNGN